MTPPVRSMRAAANEFLRRLDEPERARAAYAFDDAERYRWQYTPGPRGGLSLAAMSPAQRDAAHALLRSGLSEAGYAEATGIMALETVLRDLERRQGRSGYERRDPDHYWFAVFGDPDRPVWGWRTGGHHVCVHLTVVGGEAAFMPLFLGANPATAPDGSRRLAAEEDGGHALVRSLDDAQRAAAVLDDRAPDDIITGSAARAEIAAVPTGIGYADLDRGQRVGLADLVACYARRAARQIPVDLPAATFAWLGSTTPGERHYYAVRAGSLLIELDNTQNEANHVHSVVRDVTRDWGEDLLAAHYADAH